MPNGTYDFKLGIYLSELQLPFEESLAVARDLGVRYVWGGDHRDKLPLFRLPDAEIDESARLVDSYGCQFFFTDGGGLFKTVHLAELVPGKMLDHVQFKEHYDSLTRSMDVASRLGIGAVACSSNFTLHWFFLRCIGNYDTACRFFFTIQPTNQYAVMQWSDLHQIPPKKNY